jgi:hypothetical protein
MRRFGAAAAVALVLVGAAARPAAAQILNGVPLGVAPSGTGIVLGLDYGSPEGGDAAYGLTGGIGFSRFGVAASVGSVDFGNLGDATNYGAMAGMRLFGGGLNPLAIGAQAGVLSTDMTGGSVTGYNVGANVRFSPPLFPLKPWGVVYYAMNDAPAEDEMRVSVGLDFNLVLGLGVHAAYDWGDSGSTWGVGAHFKFGVPGM